MENHFEAPFATRLFGAGLKGFEDFWKLERNWVEPPNRRRGGWSGATQLRLDTPEGLLSLFVKRQENHCYLSWRHPFRGRPTFYREWVNIHRLRSAGVPTLDPVYYGERLHAGRYQAVLATLALDGFCDLDKLFGGGGLSDTQREQALKAAAEVCARFHQSGLRHNCLGGNHLMLRLDESGAEARLLDLEKVKDVRNRQIAASRDLARFIRHSPTLSPQDHLEFMLAYGNASVFTNVDRLVSDVNQALRRKHLQKGRPAHQIFKVD